MTPLVKPVSDNHVGVRRAAKMEWLVENGSCLVCRQLLSSAATAATKVVGNMSKCSS